MKLRLRWNLGVTTRGGASRISYRHLQARSLVCRLAEVLDWSALLQRGVCEMLSLLAFVASARVVQKAEALGGLPVLS